MNPSDASGPCGTVATSAPTASGCGERFRRRTYAQRHFALLTNRRSSSDDITLWRSRFDDRGAVYLRQESRTR